MIRNFIAQRRKDAEGFFEVLGRFNHEPHQPHNIRVSFKPHEKHIIAELFGKTKHAERFFSLVSPQTVLKLWKNAIAKYWADFRKNRKSGRPPVSKEIKNLILKLKQENILWGARRIRDEIKKLSTHLT